MIEPTMNIRHLIQAEMKDQNILDVIPIPTKGDRMARMQTIEEALQDFETEPQIGEMALYLVRAKKAKMNQGISIQSTHAAPTGTLATAAKRSPAAVDAETARNAVAAHTTAVHSASAAAQQAATNQTHIAPAVVAEKPVSITSQYDRDFLEKQAQILMKAGEHKLARRIYNAVLKDHAPSYSTLMGLGTCLDAEGRLTDAIQTFEHAQAYQGTVEVQQRLLELYLKNAQIPSALEKIDRLICRPTVDHDVRMNLLKRAVEICISHQKQDRAENYCIKAIEIDSNDHFFRRKLAGIYTDLGRMNEAREQMNEVLKGERKSVTDIIHMGKLQENANKLAEAHDLFCQALEQEPNNGTAMFHLVKLAYSLKKYERAAQFLSQYVDLGPINANLMYSLAGLHFHLGQYSKAKETAFRVLSMKVDHKGAKDLINLVEKL